MKGRLRPAVLPRRRLAGPIAIAMLALFLSVRTALAHVTVRPDHSTLGAAEQYTVAAPSERVVPTVKVRLLIPAGVVVYSLAATPGWQTELQEDAGGHITGITWSGGLIPPNQYARFGFMARNPSAGSQIVWKAYQTYQDGLVVAWTGPANSRQPAAITLLGRDVTSGIAGDAGSSSDSSLTAEVALALAALALALGLVSSGLLILLLRRRLV